jgi:hypothetical protein
MVIDQDKRAFYSQQTQRTAEPGEFRLMMGISSTDSKLETGFELVGS